MSLFFLIFWFILLLMTSFLFSGSETGLLTIPRFKIVHNANKGTLLDRLLLRIVDDKEKFIIVLLIGNNISNIIITVIALMIVKKINLVSILETYNIPVALAYAIPTIILTAFLMVFAEIYPKNIYRTYNYKMMRLSILPLMFFNVILSPIAYLLHKLTIIIPFLKQNSNDTDVESNSLNLIYIAKEAAKDGEIVEKGDELIQSVLDMDATFVKDIMVSINSISKIQYNSKIKDIKQIKEIDNAYFFPVFNKDIPLGAFYLFDILEKDENEEIVNYINPMERIKENTSIDKALIRFLNENLMMAIVENANGIIVGFLSRRDILNKIFGSISTNN